MADIKNPNQSGYQGANQDLNKGKTDLNQGGMNKGTQQGGFNKDKGNQGGQGEQGGKGGQGGQGTQR